MSDWKSLVNLWNISFKTRDLIEFLQEYCTYKTISKRLFILLQKKTYYFLATARIGKKVNCLLQRLKIYNCLKECNKSCPKTVYTFFSQRFKRLILLSLYHVIQRVSALININKALSTDVCIIWSLKCLWPEKACKPLRYYNSLYHVVQSKYVCMKFLQVYQY